ncbi:hypothetical protein [Vulcanococcus sp.]|uniref:hypothetical protein n=1 Tax=Vulcanococcus sp. TaxID=2856995 RepID=UPI003F6995E4
MDPSQPNALKLYRVTHSWGSVQLYARDLPHAITTFQELCPNTKPLSICLTDQWQ